MRRALPLLALAALLAAPAAAPAADTLATVAIGPPGQLNEPVDLTLDAEGNVIVADTQNHRVVKLAPDGTVAWVAGTSGPDGPVAGNGAGEFSQPKDVAVGPDGAVYVADSENSRFQRLSNADGSFIAAMPLRFSPQSIAVDADGTIWSADSNGDQVVKLDANGGELMRVGTRGEQPGQFKAPFDASVAGGFVYVADGFNSRVQKFTTAGGFVAAWGRKVESLDRPKPGELDTPNGIAATAEGRVFVIDRGTARLDEFSASGQHRLRFGDERQLARPGGVFARGDDVVIADTGNSRVIRLVRAQAPPAGAYCDSSTGSCSVGPNGVPVVSMPSGGRSAVRFVTPQDTCVRNDRGANLGRDVFFNGRRYELRKVAEGFMVEIPADDLTGPGSVVASWKCPKAGAAGARAAQGFEFDIVNENLGEVALVDPSGFVRDARTRRGIPGAVVTLESATSFGGPFGFVDPLGISPRVNPQRTDRRGHYGWDVPDGFYRIRVTAFGYRTLKASRVVSVPPPVTDLHVRLRRNASQQRRLIDPRGSVGPLRLGMSRAKAQRAARRMRPRPRLRFRRGRLSRIEVRSRRYRATAAVGPRSREAELRVAYGRQARRSGRGRRARYRVRRAVFSVPRSNGSTRRIRSVVVGR